MWHEDGASGGANPGVDPAGSPVPAQSQRAGAGLSPRQEALRRRILAALAELAAVAARKSANLLLGETQRGILRTSVHCLHEIAGELLAGGPWPRSERDGEIVLHLSAEAARQLGLIRADAQVGAAIVALMQVDAAARTAFLRPQAEVTMK